MIFKMTDDQIMSAPMSDDDFAEWYVEDILKTELPDKYIDLHPRICKNMTRKARLYAIHFGITRPDLQGQYMTIAWALGPNFFETPAFRKILDRTDISQVEKVDLLYKVSDAEGGAAATRADDMYWSPWLIQPNILGLKQDPLWGNKIPFGKVKTKTRISDGQCCPDHGRARYGRGPRCPGPARRCTAGVGRSGGRGGTARCIVQPGR